ncbi:MAG: hypothetical protein KGQ41_07470 [Alphaproteobacteria bacterium]|nr:hypothetical protein [Alphaproteobacteria bacterium]
MAGKDKYGFRESYPRFYKADYELQKKVGTGTLDQGAVSKVQEYLDSVQSDITPELKLYLSEMETALNDAKQISYGREEFLSNITKPLMNIKSASGMFHEMMVCRVSSFVLTFVEDVRKLDNDVMDILGAYVRVSKTLIELKIKDETNPHGQSFLTEIRNACRRYYDKQAGAVKG